MCRCNVPKYQQRNVPSSSNNNSREGPLGRNIIAPAPTPRNRSIGPSQVGLKSSKSTIKAASPITSSIAAPKVTVQKLVSAIPTSKPAEIVKPLVVVDKKHRPRVSVL